MLFFYSIIGNINFPGFISGFTGQLADIPVFLSLIFGMAITLGGVLSLANIIWAGYLYITSNDEPNKLQQARSKLMYTVIGLALISTSMLITAIIGALFFGDAYYVLNFIIYGPS